MRNRTVVVLGLAGIFILSGCSSTSDEPSQSKTTNSTTANTAAVNTGDGIASAQPADANSTASAGPIGPAANRMESRLMEMRKAGQASSDIDPAASALRNARPAPDNSTFASYLTDAGYEIRTFNNHPQLLKAEKKTASDGKQSLKIFLRDGKIVQASANKVPTLSTAPAALLLEAAGIRQPAAPLKGDLPGAQGQKKSGQ